MRPASNAALKCEQSQSSSFYGSRTLFALLNLKQPPYVISSATMSTSSTIFFLDLGLSRNDGATPNGRIMACNSGGSGVRTVVEHIETAPDGLGIDLANRHIYYTNMGNPSTNSGFISRVDMDGKNKVVNVPMDQTWTPKQLALELTLPVPKIYWCDCEGMRVFRCNLNGSEVEVLVQAGVGDEARNDARN